MKFKKPIDLEMQHNLVDLKILTLKTVYETLSREEQLVLLGDLMKSSNVDTFIVNDVPPRIGNSVKTKDQVKFDFETWITANINNECRIIERTYMDKCHDIYEIIRSSRAGGYLNQVTDSRTLQLYTVINGDSEKAKPSPGSPLLTWIIKRSAANVLVVASYPIGVRVNINYLSLLQVTLYNLENIKVILFLLNCLTIDQIPDAVCRFKELFPEYTPQTIHLSLDGQHKLKTVLKISVGTCNVYPVENMALRSKKYIKQKPFYTYP